MSNLHKVNNAARTCAVHNPGDLACDESCAGRLRANDDASDDAYDPEAELAPGDDAVVADLAPQSCVFHVGGMHCPDGCQGRLASSSAMDVASVDEMDEAVSDIERRDRG